MRKSVLTVFVLLALGIAAAPAAASHSWGGYHWGRTANPFTVKLGNNVTTAWTSYYTAAASDWSKSAGTNANPLRAATVAGLTSGRKCRASTGRVEVCDATYGSNGWLGLAQVWAAQSHITQATAKMNDTYYTTGSKYDSSAWRGSVMCQEIGHTFGLDHQDTSGADLHTCMDYADNPAVDNTRPNAHDYDQLVTDYTHLDSSSTLSPMSAQSSARPYAIERRDSRRSSRIVERYADGSTLTTFIAWAV